MYLLNVSKPSVWHATQSGNFTNILNTQSTLILAVVCSVFKGNSKHLLEEFTNADSRKKLKGPAYFAKMF